MRRRELLLLLAGMMPEARALRAQQKAMPVIGYLSSSSPGTVAPLVTAFQEGLGEAGYVEGQNLTIEYRGERARRYRSYAVGSLVGLSADRRISATCNVGSITPATLFATLS